MEQHILARTLLPILLSANREHRLLTYETAASNLKRDPKRNARMVAQVCDLLDAAAALGGVPLLALVTVRTKSGAINPMAWKGDLQREAIIKCSSQHEFTATDAENIFQGLAKLQGKGNRAAWTFVRDSLADTHLFSIIARESNSAVLDAIDDIGTDSPASAAFSGWRYARDPKVRAAVMDRAGGICEYCGEAGFVSADGTRYLECHHIIALANDGEDRMSNVIALCPNDHREAHFGRMRAELERGMMKKILSFGKASG